MTDPNQVRKLRNFFWDCARERGVRQPFVVGVELHEDRMHGPGDMTRFYGCFGVRPGHPLQYELLGHVYLLNIPEQRRPIVPLLNERSAQFWNRSGCSFVSVNILCQVPEAYKFRQTALSRLQFGGRPDQKLLTHFRALMT